MGVAIEESLHALFELHRVMNAAPQLAWGVVRDGALCWSGGHKANENTVFRIASMTKSFTATAVLQLRDRGIFALDDPIALHAPELATVRYATSDAPAITIRDLLTMSSGLATDDPWADRHMDITDDELDAMIADGIDFAIPTGTGMQYSNLGYGLLGRVVQRSTGQTVQAIVRSELLEPLGMSHTAWIEEDLPDGVTIAAGHSIEPGGGWRDEPFCGDGAIAPMGGVFTTIVDLAKWVGFFLDAFPARDGDDTAPLRRSSRREMQQNWRAFAPDQRVALDGVRRTVQGGYGMGLMSLHHAHFGNVVTHSGGIPGFGSNMRWVPGSGIGVIALANVTYARMADATTSALELLGTNDEVKRGEALVTDRLRSASEKLVSLLGNWSDAAAGGLFSDNVFADRSRELHVAAAAELVRLHGSFTIERIEAINAAEADIHLRGEKDSFTIEFSMTPHRNPTIQYYEVRDR